MLRALILCLSACLLSPRAQETDAGSLLRRGRFAEAEAAAANALAANPDDGRALLQLAAVQAARAIEREPDKASAYAVRAAAYERLGELDLAENDLRSAAARDPAYRNALRALEQLPRERPEAAPEPPSPRPPFVLLGALLVATAVLFGAAALFFRKT